MEGKGMERMAVEEGLIKRLCQYGVERSRIVGDAEFSLLKGRDYPISAGGKENKDKTFLVYKYAGSGGVGALVYMVACLAAYAKERGYILVVDGQTCKNQYLEVNEVGRVNAWEKFLSSHMHISGGGGYSLSDVQNSKNVIIKWGRNYEKHLVPNLDFLRMKSELEKQVRKFSELYLSEKGYWAYYTEDQTMQIVSHMDITYNQT